MVKLTQVAACRLALVALAIVTDACSTYPKTFSNESPIASFNNYTTYNFVEQLGTDEDDGVRSLLTQYLIAEVQGQMTSRGYRFTEENADISFDFALLTKEKIRSTPTGYGGGYYGHGGGRYGTYGGYGYSERITQYTEGSLYVSIVDNATNGVVWEGVSVSRIDDEVMENLSLSIEAAVSDMFAQFPHYAAGAAPPVVREEAAARTTG